jgi:hypothetical protein
MNTREYVAQLDDQIKKQIIADHEQFERDGFIGDCALRQYTKECMSMLGAPDYTVVIFMGYMATECYRVFAHRYLSEGQ